MGNIVRMTGRQEHGKASIVGPTDAGSVETREVATTPGSFQSPSHRRGVGGEMATVVPTMSFELGTAQWL